MRPDPHTPCPAVPPVALARAARQSRLSDPGRHAALLSGLPADPAGLARTVQGLLIYEHVAEPFYGCRLPAERRAESHIRPLQALLDVALGLDPRPLDVARPPGRRVVGICRHFMLLALAIFRHHGVPARGRAGFGDYFRKGTYEDHWLVEYFRADEGRWALLDSQFDAVFIERLSIRHDVLDVPRDRFLTAPEAWRRCRSGALDPGRFGIEFSGLRGLWFVAGSVIRDAAALNGWEMLPWDVWGAQPSPHRPLQATELAFIDELAELSADPDRHGEALARQFQRDPRLAVPPRVTNALRGREESVF